MSLEFQIKLHILALLQYPGFGSSVYGEEDNQFYSENKKETLIIRMTDSVEEVSSLLCTFTSIAFCNHSLFSFFSFCSLPELS